MLRYLTLAIVAASSASSALAQATGNTCADPINLSDITIAQPAAAWATCGFVTRRVLPAT